MSINSSSRSSIGVTLLRANMDTCMVTVTTGMTAVGAIGETDITMAVNMTITMAAVLVMRMGTAIIVEIVIMGAVITAMITAAALTMKTAMTTAMELTVKIPALKPTFGQKL